MHVKHFAVSYAVVGGNAKGSEERICNPSLESPSGAVAVIGKATVVCVLDVGISSARRQQVSSRVISQSALANAAIRLRR